MAALAPGAPMAPYAPGAPGAPGAPAGVPDASSLSAPWDLQPPLGQSIAQPSQTQPAAPGVDQLTSLMPQLSLNDPAQASANLAAMMWQMAQQNPAFANSLGAMSMASPWNAPVMPPSMPGANIVPPLNVRVDGLKFEYQLTDDDVRKVFSRYGEVKTVMVDREGTYATVLFENPANAVTAQRDLDGKQLAGMSGAFLRVDFPPPAPFDHTALPPAQMGQMPGFPPSPMLGMPSVSFPGMVPHDPQGMGIPSSPAGRPKKYNCKLEVGIENESEFRVGRRVIQVARQIWQDPMFQAQDGKTRLRGKGVGGPHEAEEPLALCISCRDQGSFDRAVAYAEQEMFKIHSEYKVFCEQKGKEVPELSVKITKNSSHSAMPSLLSGGLGSDLDFGPNGLGVDSHVAPQPDPPRGEAPPGAPTEAEIESLIEERNEARKQANFKRSDEVREYLKSRGVVLMDEKGARGNFKGAQVTKWRYWRP